MAATALSHDPVQGLVSLAKQATITALLFRGEKRRTTFLYAHGNRNCSRAVCYLESSTRGENLPRHSQLRVPSLKQVRDSWLGSQVWLSLKQARDFWFPVQAICQLLRPQAHRPSADNSASCCFCPSPLRQASPVHGITFSG